MSPRCLPVRMRRFSVSLNVFSAKGPQQEERVSAASTVCAPRRELDEGERLSEVAAEHDRLAAEGQLGQLRIDGLPLTIQTDYSTPAASLGRRAHSHLLSL